MKVINETPKMGKENGEITVKCNSEICEGVFYKVIKIVRDGVEEN